MCVDEGLRHLELSLLSHASCSPPKAPYLNSCFSASLQFYIEQEDLRLEIQISIILETVVTCRLHHSSHIISMLLRTIYNLQSSIALR